MDNENITSQNNPRLVPADRVARRLVDDVARSVHEDWMMRRFREAREKGKDVSWLRSEFPAFKDWEELSGDFRKNLLDTATDVVGSLAKRFDLKDLLDPYYGINKEQIADAVMQDAANGAVRQNELYGRIVADCVEGIRERKVFDEDIVKGVLDMKPGSAVANAMTRFAELFSRMTEREQLEIFDRAINDNKVYFDVSPLENIREDLRDTVASMNKDFLENRGKDGHYKDWEDLDAGWRNAIEVDPADMSVLIRKAGRNCFGMLRDACVDILKEKGADKNLIDSLSPEASKKYSRRMKSSEMLKSFEEAGKSHRNSLKR